MGDTGLLGELVTVNTAEEQKSIFLRSFFPSTPSAQKQGKQAGNASFRPAPLLAHGFPWKAQRDARQLHPIHPFLSFP